MIFYTTPVSVEGRPAVLFAVRMADYWFARLWADQKNHLSLDQQKTASNAGAFATFNDPDSFVGHVRMVVDFTEGVAFDVTGETAVVEGPTKEGERP